ncbi:MAG TPA: LysR substrate-binding domain-containing protein [Azonexus sp.]|nr:LysR substrate-binding domain-containing protein [Azonexus sp.]
MWQQNLALQGEPQTPPELMQHLALQLIGGNGSAQPWRLTRGSEHWEGLPNGPLAANSPGLQREMAAHGLGIIGLDERMARPWVERGLLQRILPDWSLPSVTLWCVPPGRRLIPSRTTAFIELLRAALVGER